MVPCYIVDRVVRLRFDGSALSESGANIMYIFGIYSTCCRKRCGLSDIAPADKEVPDLDDKIDTLRKTSIPRSNSGGQGSTAEFTDDVTRRT